MNKLSRYVLAICVLVLAFTPIISSAAELGGCNLPSNNLSGSFDKSDLREMLNGLFDNSVLNSQTCDDNTCDQDAPSDCILDTQSECTQDACGQTSCSEEETCNVNNNAFNLNDAFFTFKQACTK